MILGILMSNEVKIAVLETQVQRLLDKQKELTERVRANEKVVAAIGLLGSIAVAFIGAGYFAPKAEACTPPIDLETGKMLPFTCPSHDTVILEEPRGVTDKSFDEEFPDYFSNRVTLYDTRVAHMGHDFPTWPTAGEMIQAIRDEEAKKNRNSIDEMLNSALEDMEIDYGSNDPTEQEELL
jgi:hypothetical protein